MAVKKEATEKPAVNNKVKVFIPRQGKYDTERYLAVNGRRILVKTNQTVWLPPEFAEVYENSLSAQEKAQAYIMANSN